MSPAVLASFRLLLLLGLLLVGGSAAAQPGSADSLPLSAQERAWIAAHPVVRVGVSTEFPPYYFAGPRGRYEGFVIDLMDRLAQRTGITFEYRRYDRFGDILLALQKGEVDATPFTSETAQRRGYMRFAKPLFSTQMVLVADRRLSDVTANDSLSGYRVAVEKLSTSAELLAERYPLVKTQVYDSPDEAILAVAAGDADIFVGYRQVAVYFMEKHLTANLTLRGILATPGTALGPAVRRDLPELVSILDKAIEGLSTDEIDAVAKKWMPRSVLADDAHAQLRLSASQRQWVQAHDTVRIGFDASFAPISFANKAGGFDGLAADITHAVTAKLGLIVAYEDGASFASVYERALRGELDVIVAAARNEERSRHFDFVGPFLQVPTVVVAAIDRQLDAGLETPGRLRVALLRQHFLLPLLRSRYPNAQLIEFNSQADALSAVRAGEADLALGNMKVVNQLLEAYHTGSLQAVGIVPQGDSALYFAVRKSLPELAPILRAALDDLSPAQLSAIEAHWLQSSLLIGMPWQRVLLLGSVGLAAASLIIGLLGWSNRRLRLAQAALNQARRLAEDLVAARAAFSAYLTHELRGTLGGLAAGLGLIETQAVPAERQPALLKALTGSANGLLDLCERTLDFERMLQGGADLQPGIARLAEVAQHALAPLAVQAEIKGLRLDTELPFDAATEVLCDAVRLTQVIQNLAGNAVKFTAAGGVRVRLELLATSGLRITVSDSGPGVPEAEQGQLFQAFAQGEAGRRAGRGAGLGLNITTRIVEAMGGSLRLAETGPQGSSFVVEVKLIVLNPAAE